MRVCEWDTPPLLVAGLAVDWDDGCAVRDTARALSRVADCRRLSPFVSSKTLRFPGRQHRGLIVPHRRRMLCSNLGCDPLYNRPVTNSYIADILDWMGIISRVRAAASGFQPPTSSFKGFQDISTAEG